MYELLIITLSLGARLQFSNSKPVGMHEMLGCRGEDWIADLNDAQLRDLFSLGS